MKNKGKERKYLWSLGIIGLVIVIAGATFAYFSALASNNNKVVGTLGDATGISIAVSKVTNTGSNLLPVNFLDNTNTSNPASGNADQFALALGTTRGAQCQDSNGNNVCQVYSITVRNNSANVAVEVEGKMTLTGTATNMYWQKLSSANATTRASGAVSYIKGTEGTLVASEMLQGSGTATYYVVVWLEETGSPQESTDAGKSFGGRVSFNAIDKNGNSSGVTAVFGASLPTLYQTIASLADTTTTINFTNSSVEDNSAGVYLFSGSDADGGSNPIYYYRGGDIDNNPLDNNVLFNNFCWKIVRTTSNGGVKLIYNGTPINNQCTRQLETGSNGSYVTTLSSYSAFNSSSDAAKYVGYTYDTNTPSTIKGVIDSWYSSNMTNVTSKLEDTVWCNDRSGDAASYISYNNETSNLQPLNNNIYRYKVVPLKVPPNTYYFSPYNRAIAGTPSLGCTNSSDAYTVSSGKLQYPVALLTSDEIMLAGGGYNKTNQKYYLYNGNGRSWWSLSPGSWSGGEALGLGVFSSGALYSNSVGGAYGVRLAVSLKPGTTPTSGDGSANTPFVIE